MPLFSSDEEDRNFERNADSSDILQEANFQFQFSKDDSKEK